MANDLMLRSLEIRRFRGIRELKINRLGRVNLLVGRNNVGKTTVLEALRLYANPGRLNTLIDILGRRDELLDDRFISRNTDLIVPLPIASLFYDHKTFAGRREAISIGPGDSDADNLLIESRIERLPVHVIVSRGGDPGPIESNLDGDREGRYAIVTQKILAFEHQNSVHKYRLGHPDFDFKREGRGAVATTEALSSDRSEGLRQIHTQFTPSIGYASSHLSRLWDNISLTNQQESVLAAIRRIAPAVQRVGIKDLDFDSDQGAGIEGPNASRAPAPIRVPYVKLGPFDEPVPLRSLGDGAVRLFGISLALANARGGCLLVDEIENGFHYSAQVALWEVIFDLARELQVQVFATSHSYDCIKAFDRAARRSEEEGMLIRLANRNGETLVGEFDEDELEIAIDGEIEVR